jgi:hypothetical protein
MKDVPRKLVTVLAEVALPRCIVPVRYVTRLTAIPSVVSLSIASPPDDKTQNRRVRDQIDRETYTDK